MKKTIAVLIVFMLMMTVLKFTTGNVFAGDEENPEIKDETDDLFGIFARQPSLFNFFKSLKIFDIETFDFMDIKSAWFYEVEGRPDYLYTAIKLKNLDFINQRTIYAVHWKHNEKSYAVAVHVYSDGAYKSFFCRTNHWSMGQIL